MILFNLRDSEGLEKWSVAQGDAMGDGPVFQTSRESNIIPVTRWISDYLFYYNSIINGNTKLSNRIQTMQTSMFEH